MKSVEIQTFRGGTTFNVFRRFSNDNANFVETWYVRMACWAGSAACGRGPATPSSADEAYPCPEDSMSLLL